MIEMGPIYNQVKKANMGLVCTRILKTTLDTACTKVKKKKKADVFGLYWVQKIIMSLVCTGAKKKRDMGPVYSSVKKGDMGLVCTRVKKTETSLVCTRVKKSRHWPSLHWSKKKNKIKGKHGLSFY